MPTIGSFSGFPPPPPPLEAKAAHSLAEKIETGDISRTDGAALASSLQSIHGELKAERAERKEAFSAGAEGRSRPSREELGNKFHDLISEQVENGALSEEQGEQLSDLFSEILSQGPKGPNAEGGRQDTGRAGNRPPPLAGAREGQGAGDALIQFLQLLQEESATEYNEQGSLTSNQSLLFDYSA